MMLYSFKPGHNEEMFFSFLIEIIMSKLHHFRNPTTTKNNNNYQKIHENKTRYYGAQVSNVISTPYERLSHSDAFFAL